MTPSVEQVSEQDTSISNGQLADLWMITIEYFNSFNYFDIIYDGESIPDGITMSEIPNVLTRIIDYAFRTSLQVMPNIVAFMQLPNINFNIQTLTPNTVNIMKQRIIDANHDTLTEDMSKEQLVLLYTRVVINNTQFFHNHIMYNSPYDISEDDSDDA